MKKAISFILTVFMTLSMFSCLGMAAYAENAVESVTYTMAKPIELIENVDGDWDTRGYYDESDNWVSEEYFGYSMSLTDYIEKFTVNYADGTSEDFYADYWGFYNENYEELDLWCNLYYEQQEKPWVKGEDNSLTVEVYGIELTIPVTIIENPVESISCILDEPIEIMEEMDGSLREREIYNEETGETTYEPFFYYWTPDWYWYVDKFIVNYNDGTTDEYFWDEDRWDLCNKEGEHLQYSTSNDQYEKPWVVGGENFLTITAFGKKVDIPVTIVENPVESFTYTMKSPIKFVENMNGYWMDNDCCDDYGQVEGQGDFYYYIDNWQKNIEKFTVNYTDGTTSDFVYDDGSFYNDKGEYFNYNTNNEQYSKPWVKGGENYFTISYYGKKVTVPVEIVENRVDSISFTPAKPIVIAENRDCCYDTSDFYKKVGNTITLNYTDSTSENFVYNGEDFVSATGEILAEQYFDVDTGNYWEGCGTYSFTLSYLGAETEIPFEIVSDRIESISFEPKDPVKYIINEGMSIYKIGNVITITYADGRVVDYEYRIYENAALPYYEQGIGWYDEDNNLMPSRFDMYVDYDSYNLVPGKNYTATLYVEDYYYDDYLSTDFSFTVDVPKVKSISVKLPEEIKLTQNIDSTKDMETGISGVDYYYFDEYRIPEGTAVTVNYKNGTSDVFYKKTVTRPDMVEGYVVFVNADGEFLDYYYETNQYDKPWVIGTNYFEFIVYGVSTLVPVTVLSGPISMDVIPPSSVQVEEHTNGYWDWDEDDGECYRYYVDKICGAGWKIVLKYANGSSVEYITKAVDDGEWYAVNSKGEKIQVSYSSGSQPWEMGGDNYINVEYCAFTTSVPVTIVDSPKHEVTVHKVVEPTCTNEGYTEYVCEGCEYNFTGDYTERNGHNIVDGVCTSCGVDEETALGIIKIDTTYEFEIGKEFTFTVPETGRYKFASYGNGDPKLYLYVDDDEYSADDNNGLDFELVVDLDAGEIVTGRLYNYNYYETIIFDVTYVGASSGGNEGGDEGDDEGGDDDIPGIGDTIVEGNFEAEIVSENGCIITYISSTDGTELTIPSQIKGYDVVGVDEYVSKRNVEILNLPETIEWISAYSFEWWTSLKEINIAEGNGYFKSQNGILYDYYLEQIIVIPSAFCGELVIPLGTTELSDSMLSALKNAKSVSVAEGHTEFAEEDGIIYNSDFTKIYFAKELPANYVMKASVEEVAPYAFAGNETVKSATISSNVTEIAYAAFEGCSALETVDLPEGLLVIDENAFAENTALKAVKLPSTTLSIVDRGFYNCSSLKDITLNDGLAYVGDSVFEGAAVESVTIPDSLCVMGDSMFANCTALSQVKLNNTLHYIGSSAFWYCTSLKQINIPSSVGDIGESAFAGSGLTSIKIPANVRYIGGYSFGGCDDLKTVEIAKGLRYIGESGFAGCGSLISINIPDSVTGIEDRAFFGCSSLTSLSIPDSVIYMGNRTFMNCSKLTSLKLSKNVTYFTYHQFDGCTSLQDFEIPSTLLAVDGYALDNTGWYNSQKDGDLYFKHILYGYKNTNNNNTVPANYKLDVNYGARSIANYAFADQSGLTKVELPNTMEYIGYRAFFNCKNLTSVVIPASVTYIESESVGYVVEETYDEEYGEYYDEIKINPNLVIYGVPGSAAEEYAKENGLQFKQMCTHGSTKWVVDKDSTCSALGSKHKECTSCGAILETATIAKKAHTAGAWKIDKASTCSAAGSRHQECTVCKAVIKTEAIAKKAHTPSDWKIDKAATASAAGSKHKECTVCKTVLQTAKIAQLKAGKPKLSKIENTSSGIKVTWGKVSGADTYEVYRKTSSKGKYSKIGTTSKTYFTDKKAKSGKKYYYAVKSVNEVGKSDYSKSLSKLYLADPTLKTPKSAKNGITLKWNKITGAEGYVIYYKTGSGSYKKLTTVKGNAKVTYTHTKAKKGKTYTYKVKAYKGKTYSAYSNAKKIKDKY